VIVVLAAAGVLYLLARRNRRGGGRDGGPDGSAPPRDYRQERADDRQAGMSEEDRAWEAASLPRNQRNQDARDQVARDQ
jgi:uncharacterized protein with von Willebrand factor type A (vWA) domain